MKWLILIFLLICIPYAYSEHLYIDRITFDDNGTVQGINKIFNGTIVESIYSASGKFNGSYYFDGVNDTITFPYWYNLTDNYSISIWVKFGDASGYEGIIDREKYNSPYTGFGLYRYTDNKIYGDSVNGTFKQVSTGTTTDQNWHHIVVTKTSSGNLTIYKDNVRVASILQVGITNYAEDWQIGRHQDGSNNQKYLYGYIDEWYIFNFTLSENDIDGLYLYNNADACTLTNSSWTEWQNLTDCNYNDYIYQNRSRFTYATYCSHPFTNVSFFDYKNVSCQFLEMQRNNNLLNDIYGVFAMIGGILLFLGLWFLAYHMIQTGNMYVGWGMLLLSIPLDIFLSVMFQESNFLGSGFLGIAFSVMALFTLPAMILIKRKVKTL